MTHRRHHPRVQFHSWDGERMQIVFPSDSKSSPNWFSVDRRVIFCRDACRLVEMKSKHGHRPNSNEKNPAFRLDEMEQICHCCFSRRLRLQLCTSLTFQRIFRLRYFCRKADFTVFKWKSAPSKTFRPHDRSWSVLPFYPRV